MPRILSTLQLFLTCRLADGVAWVNTDTRAVLFLNRSIGYSSASTCWQGNSPCEILCLSMLKLPKLLCRGTFVTDLVILFYPYVQGFCNFTLHCTLLGICTVQMASLHCSLVGVQWSGFRCLSRGPFVQLDATGEGSSETIGFIVVWGVCHSGTLHMDNSAVFYFFW